jgi:DNA anti-recombination protein RmuC
VELVRRYDAGELKPQSIALRQLQFTEEIHQTYRLVIAGPTTLSAIVGSFRMGFQT